MEDELINKNLKKKKNILIISILSTIIILLGSTYAFFTYFKSASAFTLTSNSITCTFTEGTNQISFTNAYPISDEFALQNLDKLDYIDFTVSGNATNSSEAVTYEIFLTEDTNNTLDKNYIKTYVTDNNGSALSDPTMYESLPITTYGNEPTGRVVLQKTYAGEFTRSYRLYIWLDSTYEQNTVSQTFSFYVNIYAYNDLETNAVNRKYTASQLIDKIKTSNLKTENDTPLNYVTETDNGETITYLSGCSKYYLDQEAEGCTQDNTIDFNYVWYSGRMWRIVSFNETTNTIKLITEQLQTVIAFNADATNDATKVNFYNNASDTSYMYQWLNEDFYDSLYNPDDVINKTIQFNATQTSSLTTKPATTTMVTPTNGIGLINAYEYTRTYNKVGSSSSYYGYLNIGQYWWLLNPLSASGVWLVYYDGRGSNNSPTNTNGARPSINLKSGVTFTGSGTEDDPYRVISDKEIPDNTTTPINSRNVGEYIKLKSGNNEQVFRIVSFEESGNSKTTKVVAIDYANSGNTLKFATSNSSGNGTVWGSGNTTGSGTWYYYLNNTYLPNLRTTYGSGMFTSGTYYLGWKATTPSDTTTTYNYKTSICSSDTTDPVSTCTKASGTYQTFDIGLLRYGEMFASQHGIGYNFETSSYLTKPMWLLTRYSASRVWYVRSNGYGYYSSPTLSYGARPSVNLSSGVRILSGSGTELDPFVVGL